MGKKQLLINKIFNKLKAIKDHWIVIEDEPDKGFIHIKTPDYELKATFGDKESMLRIDDFIFRECSSRGYFDNDNEEEY